MVKRDRTGEPVNEELDSEEREADVKNGGKQDMLINLGQEEIKEIEKLRKNLIKKLMADLKPTNSDEKYREIKAFKAMLKVIGALFVANDIYAKKQSRVDLKIGFDTVFFDAEISFSESIKQPTLLGEIDIKPKIKKSLVHEYIGRY